MTPGSIGVGTKLGQACNGN